MSTQPDGGGWDRPRPYHRTLRTRTYAWWRPLLGLAVALVLYLTLAVLAFAVPLVVELVVSDDPEAVMDSFATLDLTPNLLLATNLSLAAIIPAVALALLAAHVMAPGWLSSVAGRLRWGLLARTTGAALVVVPLTLAVSLLLPAGEAGPDPPAPPMAELLAYLLVVALSTPLQAAAEEYGFRGYGLQVVGAWVRAPWVGVVVTSLLFAFAHGSQSPALFLDRFAFGATAAVLVLLTGGLEAAIAMHAVNNVTIFVLTAATGGISDALAASELPWSLLVLDVLQMGLFAGWALWIARRQGVSRSTPGGPPAALEARPGVGYPAPRPVQGQWGMG